MSVEEVEPDEAQALVTSGAMLLDVRQPDEWEAGHAPGATFVPLGTVPEHLDDLPRDRRIVAVCRVGGRSARATEFLVAQGFDVVNLRGGMQAWAEAGHPVETEGGATGVVT